MVSFAPSRNRVPADTFHLHFKEAESEDELQQVHALNHRVFAEEIAQHHTHASGLLVDRYHAQNRYFIALRGDLVIGMISAHAGPEFSVTKRLPNPAILADFTSPLEVRLLAIAPEERKRTVLAGLLWQVYSFAVTAGFSHLLISAITQRESMYRKLGFRSLGPAVPEGAASFIPMVMDLTRRASNTARTDLHARRWTRHSQRREPVSLMPGPVCVDKRVAEAFASPPISHRSPAFIESYEVVRSLLTGLLNGAGVALFSGTGTLANDAVAANLKAIFGNAKGIIVSNGEFGERIARQGAAAGLQFQHLQFRWGDPWSLAGIENGFNDKPHWIWAVQLETSTGVLNDTHSLLRIAGANQCAVALDCVSSVGATPITSATGTPLLASGVSGKSLGSYAGLCFVYLSEECRSRLAGKTLCPSFDLLAMYRARGPVSTMLSPTLAALRRALEIKYASPEAIARRFGEYFSLGEHMRRRMREVGLDPLADESLAAPNIATFALPNPSFPQECLQEAGYYIAHESPYLQCRGWGQIAAMGAVDAVTLDGFFDALRSWNSSTLSSTYQSSASIHFGK